MKYFFSFLIVIACFSSFLVSCKKDKTLTDPSAKVDFSQDSVLFDTVFTTIGSTTRNIRIINNNDQKIKLSSVRLEKGASSNFIMNVDGISGKSVNDVEILAHDSIYVFIQVNVDPTNQNSPLIIQDRILVDLNGNQQSVALEAWGQDAYYHYPNQAIQFQTGYLPYSTIAVGTNTTVTWNNDKPHVVYGWLVVDSLQKLVINQGVRVYFHQNAGLWVYRYGTLQVNGVLGNEVIFQGDRREADYADLPGQWDRIWINEGHNDNHINYAIIKNSFIGIQTEVLSDINAPKRLKLTNTIVKNCSKWGLYSVAYSIWGGNNLIANCKEYCMALTLGGDYTFIHSTFANYFNKEGGRGGQPCVHLDNTDGTTTYTLDSMYFANCIIDGSQGNELETTINSVVPNPVYQFNTCLIKTTSPLTGTISVNNRYNQNADFKDPANYDYRLNGGSAAINFSDLSFQGLYLFLVNDLKGSSRAANPDAGAYQH